MLSWARSCTCMRDEQIVRCTATCRPLLWRQWLLKRRSWKSTIMEILSPVLLISLLVVAFYKVSFVFQLRPHVPAQAQPLLT